MACSCEQSSATEKQTSLIGAWCWDIIHGVGGVHDYEHYEKAVFDNRDEGIAYFVIEALANPDCKNSQEILNAINERRAELMRKVQENAK